MKLLTGSKLIAFFVMVRNDSSNTTSTRLKYGISADEEKPIADLQALLLPRIKAALLGEVSDQSFEEIVDEGLREGHPS